MLTLFAFSFCPARLQPPIRLRHYGRYRNYIISWWTVTAYVYNTVYRLVIPLSLGDCSTATNKAAFASRNNDQISLRPSSQVAYIDYSGVCWWHHEIRKLQHRLQCIMLVLKRAERVAQASALGSRELLCPLVTAGDVISGHYWSDNARWPIMPADDVTSGHLRALQSTVDGAVTNGWLIWLLDIQCTCFFCVCVFLRRRCSWIFTH